MKLNRSNVVRMQSELEMLGFLKANGTACRFVGITTRTPVVKMKVGNPFHVIKGGKVVGDCGLFKVSQKIGVINMRFNTAVEKRIAEKLGVAASEVEYVAGETWYQHLQTADNQPLPVVEHKDETKRGEYYLQYFPQTEKSKSVYVNAAGEIVPNETVKPWLYAESDRPDYKPAVIAVKLSNIHRLAATGVVLEMPELDEVAEVLAD